MLICVGNYEEGNGHSQKLLSRKLGVRSFQIREDLISLGLNAAQPTAANIEMGCRIMDTLSFLYIEIVETGPRYPAY